MGYFVLNDVFHFVNEDGSELPQAPVGLQNNLDAQPTASYPLAEPPAHDYALEVEAIEYVNSVHIQGNDGVEEYSYPEHDHEHQSEAEAEAEAEPDDPDEPEAEVEVPEEAHLGEEIVQVRSLEEETALPNNCTYIRSYSRCFD